MRSIQTSAWLLAVASGILQVLVFPRPNLYWLCWVAIAPLIYALLRARKPSSEELFTDESYSKLVAARPWQGFLLGWASGTVFYFGACYWVYHVMHLYGGLPPVVSFGLLVLFSLFIGLHHGVFGALIAVAGRSRTGFSRKALVLAPFLWVSVELLRAYVVSFPWMLLGTAQIDNLPLARLASVTGVYGISFEIAVVNSAFTMAFLVKRSRRGGMLVAALTGAIALQSTVWVKVDPSEVDATATLVQQNVPIEREWTADSYRKLLSDLGSMSKPPKLFHDGSNLGLVVWPESPAPFMTNDAAFVDAVADIAKRDHAYVIAGAVGARQQAAGASENDVYNSAVLIAPSGATSQRYDKVHLVPWGEYVPFQSLFSFAKSLTQEVGNFHPGVDRAPLEVGNHRIGVFICYESIFPNEVRQFAARGAEVFVNISNDGWFGESGAPGQHLNMARMRAVENQRWVLRSTNTGITASIDPFGRVVAAAPRNERVTLDAPYALLTGMTFYTRYGDWFPIVCAIISLIGLLWRSRTTATMVDPQPA